MCPSSARRTKAFSILTHRREFCRKTTRNGFDCVCDQWDPLHLIVVSAFSKWRDHRIIGRQCCGIILGVPDDFVVSQYKITQLTSAIYHNTRIAILTSQYQFLLLALQYQQHNAPTHWQFIFWGLEGRIDLEGPIGFQRERRSERDHRRTLVSTRLVFEPFGSLSWGPDQEERRWKRCPGCCWARSGRRRRRSDCRSLKRRLQNLGSLGILPGCSSSCCIQSWCQGWYQMSRGCLWRSQ